MTWDSDVEGLPKYLHHSYKELLVYCANGDTSVKTKDDLYSISPDDEDIEQYGDDDDPDLDVIEEKYTNLLLGEGSPGLRLKVRLFSDNNSETICVQLYWCNDSTYWRDSYYIYPNRLDCTIGRFEQLYDIESFNVLQVTKDLWAEFKRIEHMTTQESK